MSTWNITLQSDKYIIQHSHLFIWVDLLSLNVYQLYLLFHYTGIKIAIIIISIIYTVIGTKEDTIFQFIY